VIKKYTELSRSRVDLRDAIPLPKPFAILFEPASICNFKCRFCFFNEADIYQHIEKGKMKYDDFKKIVDDLAAWPGDRIKVARVIGFGEPLVNRETPDMIRYLKERNVAERIEVTTNASLLDAEMSERLIESGLDYIRCSIYSVDPEKHQHITQNKIPIERMRDNIRTLAETRAQMGKSTPFIYVKMIDRGQEENQKFLDTYAPFADETAIEHAHSWLDGEDGRASQRGVCPQPFKMMNIHFNGDVVMCDPDWKGNTQVGNALEQPVSSIWGGETVRAFWKMQLENRRSENPSCATCSFLNDRYVLDDLDGVSPDVLQAQ
jgi:radical SAM protein with 4Fe4S-binding SPASM domain